MTVSVIYTTFDIASNLRRLILHCADLLSDTTSFPEATLHLSRREFLKLAASFRTSSILLEHFIVPHSCFLNHWLTCHIDGNITEVEIQIAFWFLVCPIRQLHSDLLLAIVDINAKMFADENALKTTIRTSQVPGLARHYAQVNFVVGKTH